MFPLLGVWDHYEDIDFSALPNQFVLKCTHDSGSVKIVKDKSLINHKEYNNFFKNDKTKVAYMITKELLYEKIKGGTS